MKRFQQVLSPYEAETLRNLLHQTIDSYSGETIETASFVSGVLELNTSRGRTNFTITMQDDDFAGELDSYPALVVVAQRPIDTARSRKGRTYFQMRGAGIVEVWILRTHVTCHSSGEPVFTYVTDDAVVLKTTSGWLSIAKASHMTHAIYISAAAERAQLKVLKPETQWVSDLVDTYECSQEWIQLA